METVLIFGLGYTASHLAERLERAGSRIVSTGHRGTLGFDDETAVNEAIAIADAILSSVPPGEEGDPVLLRYGAAIAAAKSRWIGYLSSTGVYGDTGGAWVDESASIGRGRRPIRAEADAAWLALHGQMRVFRLPGIYGPGRSALDRVREGRAHRIDLPDQVFSRIHVEDIVGAILASFGGPPGAYNIADDLPCGQNAVIEEACRLLGREPPSLRRLEEAGLSPAARAFYAENRRVANGKAKRLLGWRPLYSDYRSGLARCFALSATNSPASDSKPPTIA